MEVEQLCPVYEAARRAQAKVCMITAIDGLTGDAVEDCMFPNSKSHHTLTILNVQLLV